MCRAPAKHRAAVLNYLTMKLTLTPEQSQRLIELGVDASKASDFEYLDPYGLDDTIPTGVPIFDLSDILSLLPKEIDGYPLLILAKRFF